MENIETYCEHDPQLWEIDGQGQGYCKACEQANLLSDEAI